MASSPRRSRNSTCASAACPEIVRADCTERVDEIHRVMPSVVFDVKTSSGADVAETRVDMDGRVLRERLDGRPVSVDPGDHTFVLTARGTTQTLHVLVHEGDKDRRVAMTVAEPQSQPREIPAGGAQRAAGLIIAVSGVVSLGVGSTFGGLAIARHGDVTSVCPNNVCPSPAARDQVAGANADAQTFATASTITLIAGVVLAATGVVVFLVAPRTRVQVGLGFVGGVF